MKNALAMIECISLPAAIAAADAAVKAANVELIGYELSKGADLVTVKLSGDVAAVNAAVEAGVAMAKTITGIAGCIVIPRPAEDLERMIYNKDTVGWSAPEKEADVPSERWSPDEPSALAPKDGNEPERETLDSSGSETHEETEEEDPKLECLNGDDPEPEPVSQDDEESMASEILVKDNKEGYPEQEVLEEHPAQAEQQDAGSEGPNAADTGFGKPVTCNLCHDPECQRHKGEPRSRCIHAPQ